MLSPPPSPTPAPELEPPPQAAEAARPARARRRSAQDPKRWGRRTRGALSSLGLHAAVLGLLSVWALPHLRGEPEARSAHLETSWAEVSRTEAAPAAPAPTLEEPESAPALDPEWEPSWEEPSPASPPAPAPPRPDPGVQAARQFRSFEPVQPKPAHKPAPAQPAQPKPKPKQRRKAKPASRTKRRAARAPAPASAARRSPPPRGKLPVLEAPRVKSRPQVKLPSRCRRRGHQGQARLLLEVDPAGGVKSSRVVNSTGCSRLDETAREAGLRYRFRPGTRDGQASPWLVYVVIEFGTSS